MSDTSQTPSAANNRCATRADLRGDSMLGTAFPAARLLLVEQAGNWGRRGLRDSRFPAALAEEVERRATAAGLRVQVIRRPGRVRAHAGPWAWAIADTRPGVASVRWGAWDDPAELTHLALDGSTGTTAAEPVYLVCAHGKHDVCCALRGRPVAQALADARPGQVWETSHLGGDRFGANVLALPLGVVYGRVLPFAAADLARATDAGEVLWPLLRGRIGARPLEQVALAHVAMERGLRRADDVAVLGVDGSQVRVQVPGGQVEVTVHSELVSADGLTCANPQPGSYWTYRAVDLLEVAPTDA